MINAEKPKTPQQIAKRFGKSLQEIYKTIEQVRKQKRYEKATHLDANGVRTTIYGPSYAQGAAPNKSALNKN